MPPRSPDPRRAARRGTTDLGSDPSVVPLRGGPGARRGADPTGGGQAGSGGRAGSSSGAGSAGSERSGGRTGAVPPGGQGGSPGRGALADARRYTPRGRTVRQVRDDEDIDPFRPALQVVDGGAAGATTRTPKKAGTPKPRRVPAGGATSAPGAGRGARTGTGHGAGGQGGRGGSGHGGQGGRGAGGTGQGGRGGADRPPVRRPVSRKPRARIRLGDPKRRLRLGTLLVLVLFSVIGVRLIQLQITDAAAFAEKGLTERLHKEILYAERGAILDRDGLVLAHSVEGRLVFADPTLVKDPAGTAEQLYQVLGVPKSELIPKLSPHKNDNGVPSAYEVLARGRSADVGLRVDALDLPGIGTRRDEYRDQPGRDLAANLLGFTGLDNTGLTGLESAYNELLRGVDGTREFEVGRGKMDQQIPGGFERSTPARPGGSLQLTISGDLQYRVQSILAEKARKNNATAACAVILDTRTGEVVAQASYPTYNAAEASNSTEDQWRDVATSYVVDPGSVHKAITFGAALQEGVIKPDSVVSVGPSIRKGDQTYRDTHPHAQETPMTLPGLLAYSSNIGTIKIADMLGAEKLYQYQLKFGLGQPTGEGLPGEAAGLVQPVQNWSGSSYGSIPIGMGVSVTPLQMAAAYAAIANDGLWIQPHLVKATVGADGKSAAAPAAPNHRVLSKENAAALRQMMEAVVTVDNATGRAGAIQGYRVAGKTGTGRRVVDGKYAPGEVASFIGMAPADAPRYVIAVFADSPGGTGGEVAAPAFREMMLATLAHFEVPPTGTNPPKFSVYPS